MDAMTRTLEFGYEGDDGLGDRLIAAVLRGEKTATSSLAVEYLSGEPLPRVGERLSLVDHAGTVHGVVETTATTIIPLHLIGDDVAFDEGEGYADSDAYRRGHIRFWKAVAHLTREESGDPQWQLRESEPVVVHRFRLVQAAADRPGDRGQKAAGSSDRDQPLHASRFESRHLSVLAAAPVAEVVAYAGDPANLPRWAAGLGGSIRQVDGRWVADSPMGQVTIEFAPSNGFGILDHVVTLPSGDRVLNPMRVLPAPDGAEVVFTLRRAPGATDDEFEADERAVRDDLRRLAEILATG